MTNTIEYIERSRGLDVPKRGVNMEKIKAFTLTKMVEGITKETDSPVSVEAQEELLNILSELTDNYGFLWMRKQEAILEMKIKVKEWKTKHNIVMR